MQWILTKHYSDILYTKIQPYIFPIQGLHYFARYEHLVPCLLRVRVHFGVWDLKSTGRYRKNNLGTHDHLEIKTNQFGDTVHLSMFSPRVGGYPGDYTNKQLLPPGIWQNTLTQGRDLIRYYRLKFLKKLYVNFKAHPGSSRGFLTHICDPWVGN